MEYFIRDQTPPERVSPADRHPEPIGRALTRESRLARANRLYMMGELAEAARLLCDIDTVPCPEGGVK